MVKIIYWWMIVEIGVWVYYEGEGLFDFVVYN